MKSEFSQQSFEKYSNIKIHEKPAGGSQFVPRRQTDMTSLIVAFRNFTKAHKVIFLGYKSFYWIHLSECTYLWRSPVYMK
jgi:hypothetical protein